MKIQTNQNISELTQSAIKLMESINNEKKPISMSQYDWENRINCNKQYLETFKSLSKE